MRYSAFGYQNIVSTIVDVENKYVDQEALGIADPYNYELNTLLPRVNDFEIYKTSASRISSIGNINVINEIFLAYHSLRSWLVIIAAFNGLIENLHNILLSEHRGLYVSRLKTIRGMIDSIESLHRTMITMADHLSNRINEDGSVNDDLRVLFAKMEFKHQTSTS